MKKLEYRVSFNTPAFLGNAEQAGQWRTPPFKALIRQWWRIATAKTHGFDDRVMRMAEGELFGNAWLVDGSGRPAHRKSRVRLRIEPWDPGQMTSAAWPHSIESVSTTADGKGSVRADLYLGFGPVAPSKTEGRSTISIRRAIGPEQSAVIRLFPIESDDVKGTLQLLAWFGALGSRSRNGWGSLAMSPTNGAPRLTSLPDANDGLLKSIQREFTECLGCDWPHALGALDGKPLVWLSQPFTDWRRVMGCLANVRVEARRVAKSVTGPDGVGGIHVLGYPAGKKWELPVLRKEARLASQLRFKVCASADGLVGVVFHVPHRFPDVLLKRLSPRQRDWLKENERMVWQKIHRALDGMARLKRLEAKQ